MENIKKDDKFKWYHWLGLILFIAVMVFSVIVNQPTEEEKKEEEMNELKREECRTQSNTFYKCSWSVIEDRCVCKQR